MKKSLLILFTVILFSCGQSSTTVTSENSGNTTSEKFEIKKGTNVAHWLSQSKQRGTERALFFTKEDVQNIAKMGFDSTLR